MVIVSWSQHFELEDPNDLSDKMDQVREQVKTETNEQGLQDAVNTQLDCLEDAIPNMLEGLGAWKKVSVNISGHANPGLGAREGWALPSLNVNLSRQE